MTCSSSLSMCCVQLKPLVRSKPMGGDLTWPDEWAGGSHADVSFPPFRMRGAKANEARVEATVALPIGPRPPAPRWVFFFASSGFCFPCLLLILFIYLFIYLFILYFLCLFTTVAVTSSIDHCCTGWHEVKSYLRRAEWAHLNRNTYQGLNKCDAAP